MDINHYYAYKLYRERMQKYLQEAEQLRLVKLAYPLEDKPHWAPVILKKIKDILLNLINLQDRPSVSKTRRTGSFPESSST